MYLIDYYFHAKMPIITKDRQNWSMDEYCSSDGSVDFWVTFTDTTGTLIDVSGTLV
jgi:hypothetical protein